MKFKSLRILTLLLLSLFLLLTGVVTEVIAQQTPVDFGADQPSQIGAVQSGSEPLGYSPKGRRDPFKPLIQDKTNITKAKKGRSEKFKGPLEKFELSQYRLIAIIIVNGVPRAMVKAPDGKSYTVNIGDYIGMNDGSVKKIEMKVVVIDDHGLSVEKSPDRIVVEEGGIDSSTGQEIKENRYIAM